MSGVILTVAIECADLEQAGKVLGEVSADLAAQGVTVRMIQAVATPGPVTKPADAAH
jgi:hypothetical protein